MGTKFLPQLESRQSSWQPEGFFSVQSGAFPTKTNHTCSLLTFGGTIQSQLELVHQHYYLSLLTSLFSSLINVLQLHCSPAYQPNSKYSLFRTCLAPFLPAVRHHASGQSFLPTETDLQAAWVMDILPNLEFNDTKSFSDMKGNTILLTGKINSG